MNIHFIKKDVRNLVFYINLPDSQELEGNHRYPAHPCLKNLQFQRLQNRHTLYVNFIPTPTNVSLKRVIT